MCMIGTRWRISASCYTSGLSLSTRILLLIFFFFFSSRRRHTRSDRDWSSDVCSSDLAHRRLLAHARQGGGLELAPARLFVVLEGDRQRHEVLARQRAAGHLEDREQPAIEIPLRHDAVRQRRGARARSARRRGSGMHHAGGGGPALGGEKPGHDAPPPLRTH